MTEENTLIKCSRCRLSKTTNHFDLNSQNVLYKTCNKCRSYKKPKFIKYLETHRAVEVGGVEMLEIVEAAVLVPGDYVEELIEPVEELIEPVEVIGMTKPQGLIRYDEDDNTNRKINALLKLPKNRTKSDKKALRTVSKFQQELFLKIYSDVQSLGGPCNVTINHTY
jgi:hypothetical protein